MLERILVGANVAGGTIECGNDAAVMANDRRVKITSAPVGSIEVNAEFPKGLTITTGAAQADVTFVWRPL